MDVDLSALTAPERELLKAVRLSLNVDTIAERLELSRVEVESRLLALEKRLEGLGATLKSALQNQSP